MWKSEAKRRISPLRILLSQTLNLDRKFLRRCRELGLAGTDYDLNWKLLNARKNSLLSEVPQAKRFSVKNPDDFEYASELAVRHLQRTKNVSLDQIICDPELAKEFDEFAKLLTPGKHSPLEYRWVALQIHRSGKVTAGKGRRRRRPPSYALHGIATSLLLKTGGLYLFWVGDSQSSSARPIAFANVSNDTWTSVIPAGSPSGCQTHFALELWISTESGRGSYSNRVG